MPSVETQKHVPDMAPALAALSSLMSHGAPAINAGLFRLRGRIGLPVRRCHLEDVEGKARRYGCAHQGPVAQALGALPFALGDDDLRRLVVEDVGAEHAVTQGLAVVVRQGQLQRRAAVEVPDLGGVQHAVPARDLAALEQIVDCGAGGAVGASLG